MGQRGEKLTKKQELAVMALLTEPNMEKAAEKAGIGRSTLYRWMQLDSFQEQYNQLKHETVAQATARLRQGMTIAVDTLMEMAQNKKTPAVARSSACRTLLEFGFKSVEMEDIQKRMDKLEKAMEDETA
ncbi:phBC6A51 family helix-turn-helix protein [Halobacillus karajensis]|uniref:Homeodomain phBC6A51-type domain-containing protein n=1 Tax=Halobacillus karajensis TaxID=195088 RepID=A0A024P740_9BACI|nr:hypothetical protein [Halobacillus karajensis]CDQ20982.1 hypothetical protein BN982_03343 [Halobacillus karajensis]CDQ24954.1 hypothetical protein BN983_03255 [Halobacillus karajensis]CDQ28685.1 hypothetical protein BN981_02998 [Halobacillus karajensis]